MLQPLMKPLMMTGIELTSVLNVDLSRSLCTNSAGGNALNVTQLPAQRNIWKTIIGEVLKWYRSWQWQQASCKQNH